MKNDFNVYASLLSATPADAENLASWLVDREAERKAMSMDVDETVQNGQRMAVESGGYDENIAIAQIRILSKQFITEPEVVPYVAVIGKWDDEMWLIVPFSPYKTPATPGEMSTGLDVHGLHVLQAWNGRTVQSTILKKSFLFGTITEELRQNVLSLFRNQLFGDPLPKDFSARLGSPISVAADPRREYLAECIERFKPLLSAVVEMEEKSAIADMVGSLFNKYLSSARDVALAAATDDLDPKVPMLVQKGAWDAMIDCREASGFSGYSSAAGGQSGLTLYLSGELPKELEGADGIPVEAYKRETRELVGKGCMRQLEDGRCKIVVRLGEGCEPVEVQDAGELVLVVVE